MSRPHLTRSRHRVLALLLLGIVGASLSVSAAAAARPSRRHPSSAARPARHHAPPVGQLTVLAGRGLAAISGPATHSAITPAAVASGPGGNLYIVDGYNNDIEKVSPSGKLSVIAGRIGVYGKPRPGTATRSALNGPLGVAVAANGDVYIADTGNEVVEKVTPSGKLSIVAGIPGKSGKSTSGPAAHRLLNEPQGVAVSRSGDLYIANRGSDLVDKVTPSGTLSVLAGGGTASPSTSPQSATAVALNTPVSVAVNGSGAVFISDSYNQLIEKVSGGELRVIAGGGSNEPSTASQNALSVALSYPNEITLAGNGDLYVADRGNDVVDQITPSGRLKVVAGEFERFGRPTAGPATRSELNYPDGVTIAADGDLDIADTNNWVVERVTHPGASGTLSVVAGDGPIAGSPTPGRASRSHLDGPGAVAVAANGTVYVADTQGGRVERITTAGQLSVIAGGGSNLPSTTARRDTEVKLSYPDGIAVNHAGDVYVSDAGNEVIEEITPAGQLSVIAGRVGQSGAPQPGAATDSDQWNPAGLAVTSSGNLLVADDFANVIEEITPHGQLAIFAGGGSAAPSTTARSAAQVKLYDPLGVAVGAGNTVYIADSYNQVVEKVTGAGMLNVVAGETGRTGRPTSGVGTRQRLDQPSALAVDRSGNVYIGTTGYDVVQKLTPAGTLSTVAGRAGDIGGAIPGPATATDLSPNGLATSASGDLYIADAYNADIDVVRWPR